MKACFVFGFILFSLEVVAQKEFEWTPSYKLHETDFLGTPVDSLKIDVYPDISISYHLNTLHIFHRNFNKSIYSVFSPENSFLRTRDTTSIRFAQTIFDLSEVMARELRKNFLEQGRAVFSDKALANYEALHKKYCNLREQYALESANGSNTSEQVRWENWINMRLIELSDYSKNTLKTKVAHHTGPPRYR